jgi:hypothetical protein
LRILTEQSGARALRYAATSAPRNCRSLRGITHEEQASRRSRHSVHCAADQPAVPHSRQRISVLQRVGVLELVDEHVRVRAANACRTSSCAAADRGTEEQVVEVEESGRTLDGAEPLDDGLGPGGSTSAKVRAATAARSVDQLSQQAAWSRSSARFSRSRRPWTNRFA